MKNNQIIIALDTSNIAKAKKLVRELSPKVEFFKIGLEFINTGKAPDLIKFIKKFNSKIFYDVKLNDIPNTVGRAVKIIAELGVDIISVHASAGEEALKFAVRNKGNSKVFGVTILTSINDREARYIFGHSSKKKVLQFADLLIKAKCDGMICSAKEAGAIRKYNRFNKLKIITPGIRPVWAKTNDQTRTVTPHDAIKAGADYLVIGRPITKPPKNIGSSYKALALIIGELDK